MKVPQATLVALALLGTSLGDDFAEAPPANGTDGPSPDTNTTPDGVVDFPLPLTNTTAPSVPLVPGCPDAANAVCMEVYAPLCGSDGTTYSNPCFFGRARCERPTLEVANQGECGDGVDEFPVPDTLNVTSPGETGAVSMPQTDDGTTGASVTMDLCSDSANVKCPGRWDLYEPLCGSDGFTYSNSCFFGLAQCDRPDLEVANQGGCEEGMGMSVYEASGNYTIPWVSDDDNVYEDDYTYVSDSPIVTCKEENLDDYGRFILAQPSLMSCYESFGTGFSFTRRRLEEEEDADDYYSDPHDALFEKIMSHEKCADLAPLMTGQGTEQFDGYEDDDFYSLIHWMSEVLTDDLILDACAISASALTCLTEVAQPEILRYLNTEERSGCCVGVDRTDAFQRLLASAEELLHALDAVVCDTRVPAPGTDEVTQTCGYTLLRGLAAGEDRGAAASSLLPWMQMPQDQACRAFAGESFADTVGGTGVLFPGSPLRNCAEGHDRLFSWMKAAVEDMLEVVDVMSDMGDTEEMAGLSKMVEVLSLEDMFTEGSCFDVKTAINAVMMYIMSEINNGLEMMGVEAPPLSNFGMHHRMARALQEMGSGRTRLGSVLAGVGRTVLRAGINNGAGNLRRRRTEEFDFGALLPDGMPHGDLLATAMGMCIHFPTNFAASCGFSGPSEEIEETGEAMGVASSAGMPYVPFLSLLVAVSVSGFFLFA